MTRSLDSAYSQIFDRSRWFFFLTNFRAVFRPFAFLNRDKLNSLMIDHLHEIGVTHSEVCVTIPGSCAPVPVQQQRKKTSPLHSQRLHQLCVNKSLFPPQVCTVHHKASSTRLRRFRQCLDLGTDPDSATMQQSTQSPAQTKPRSQVSNGPNYLVS